MRAISIEGQTLLLQRHAFRKFRVTWSKRAWSDCVLCHFFFFFVVKLKRTSKRSYLHTCRQLVIANWIEIRIASCLCRLQQMRHFNPTMSTLFSTLPHPYFGFPMTLVNIAIHTYTHPYTHTFIHNLLHSSPLGALPPYIHQLKK